MAEVTVHQQIFETINKANRILIPLAPSPSGDSVASALALADFLKKLNKEPAVICPSPLPGRYRFLPGAGSVAAKLQESRGFVISVRTNNAPLDELSYHLDEPSQVVNIYLKPKAGTYEPADVTFKSDRFPYDAVVVLDLPSLDQLGALYDDNTDLFFETPIINLDHHPNNEHFGEMNLVDITATSSAEILMELLESFEVGLLDGNIATNLLAGILIETNSFQNNRTTPKAFLKASSLITLGANQQEIIRNLYKTKSINLLKLWGRALARLKTVPELSMAYTLLRPDDLARAGSSELPDVMEELVTSLSDEKLVMLLAETEPNRVEGYAFIHPTFTGLEVANLLSAEMLNANLAHFVITGRSIVEAETDVLQRLDKLKQRLPA